MQRAPKTPKGRWTLRAVATTRLMVAGTALTALACETTPSRTDASNGGLQIVITSDLSIPKDIDRIGLDVTLSGRSLLHVERDIGAGGLLIPARFDVKDTGESGSAHVRAVGYKSGEPRVERDAITPIPAGYVGTLRLALNYLCVGTAKTSADGDVSSTCPEG